MNSYDINLEKVPTHIAIIMDGNGRWAKSRFLPRTAGHKAGVEAIREVIKESQRLGVKHLTLYAFSTENWKRTEEEVSALMLLLQNYLDDYSKRADTENIKVKVLGDISVLSDGMQKSIRKCEERTKDNTGVTFNIALNYGGRNEIVTAVKKIAKQVKNGELDIDNITEETISNNLYTKGEPDPDLVIRTSGELRTSNFLPWQIVYSEFLFLDKLWPDFTEEDIDNAILEFQKRNRKFGGK